MVFQRVGYGGPDTATILDCQIPEALGTSAVLPGPSVGTSPAIQLRPAVRKSDLDQASPSLLLGSETTIICLWNNAFTVNDRVVRKEIQKVTTPIYGMSRNI